jgi:FtsH-binding integral membrane protein
MSYANQWGARVETAASASVEARTSFIRKTYAHLGAAVLLFIGLELLLFKSGAAERILLMMAGSNAAFFITMILFMGAGAFAQSFASHPRSTGMQYFGLGLYVVMEALLFVPILYFAAYYSDESVIPKAGLISALVFAGLTAIVFFTGRDFSFMRTGLMVAGWAAFAVIICSWIFGFNLGTLFAGAMVLFFAGYILYYTSNVLHHYPVGSHVAASLALFSAVAMLFFYILRIFMSRD